MFFLNILLTSFTVCIQIDFYNFVFVINKLCATASFNAISELI